jgi:hypothetical protein
LLIPSGASSATSKVRAVGLLILTFLIGGIAGAVSLHLYQSRVSRTPLAGIPARPSFIELLIQTTSLDAEQQEALKTIVNKRVERYRAFDEEMRQETKAQILQILRPDQKPKFDQLLERLNEQRKQWEKRQQENKAKANNR